MKKRTVLDLFSGCGGLSHGFSQAGHDVLYDDSLKSNYPIQWTGYNSGLKQYQGEIIEKNI